MVLFFVDPPAQVDPEVLQQAPVPAPEPAPEDERVAPETTDLAAQQILLMAMGDGARAAGYGVPPAEAAEGVSSAAADAVENQPPGQQPPAATEEADDLPPEEEDDDDADAPEEN